MRMQMFNRNYGEFQVAGGPVPLFKSWLLMDAETLGGSI